MQNQHNIEGKSVPRGTLVWNGIPQNLVFVENLFLNVFGNFDITTSSSILSAGYSLFALFNVRLCPAMISLCTHST